MTKYLNRFSDFDVPPLSHFKVFDVWSWPNKLTDLSSYGQADVKALCQMFSGVLSEEESKNALVEWQYLKVQASYQKGNHPLIVYCDLLKRQDDNLKNIRILTEIMLTISPSSAACERVFSQTNLAKSPLRSKLNQNQNQMKIVIAGVSVKDFHPRPYVVYWLKSDNRHIVHKQPVKAHIAAAVAGPSGTRDTETVNVRSLLQDLIKSFGGEEAARAKLKEMANEQSEQCILM